MLELLEGAENGRYKVIAKAEPYKNLPVRINIQSLCPKKGASGTKNGWVDVDLKNSLFYITFFVTMHTFKLTGGRVGVHTKLFFSLFS